jgi:hypothetical protein
MKIGLTTIPGDKDLPFMLPVLASGGIQVETLSWPVTPKKVERYSKVFLKSIPQEKTTYSSLVKFSSVEDKNVFANPLSVISWGMEKKMLFDYEENGVRTAKTIILNNADDFFNFTEKRPEEFVVVLDGKEIPATKILENENPAFQIQSILQAKKQVVVKETVDFNACPLESFFFFGGRVSHAVRYKTKELDNITVFEPTLFRPSENLVNAAIFAAKVTEDILVEKNYSFFLEDLLFVRFDFVNLNDTPKLYDVKFHDFSFEFHLHPQGAARFLKALLGQLYRSSF